MTKYFRFGIIEDLDSVRHIPIGKFWGIQLSLTPLTWLSPIVFFLLGVALNVLIPGISSVKTIYNASVFMIGVEITTLIHALGHILGGKLVHSPMDELLLTATRGVNIYNGDQNIYPGLVHFGRAVGGPLLNLLVASVLFQLQSDGVVNPANDLMGAIASTSLFMGVGGFLPLPSVDGQVIWREVFRWVSRRRQG